MNKQMSRQSPDVFNFSTAPKGETLSSDVSPADCSDIMMFDNRVAQKSGHHTGVHKSDFFNKNKRKVQEKNRRDKLCANIDQISKLLPSTGCNSKKPTKVAILRSAASVLRLGYHFPNQENLSLRNPNGQTRATAKWKPESVGDSTITELFEVTGGFLLFVDMKGIILFATQNIEQYLSHKSADVMGHYLFDYIHDGDHAKFETTFRQALNNFDELLSPQDGDWASQPFSIICKFLEKPAARTEILSYKVMRCTAFLRGPMIDSNIDSSRMKLTLFAQPVDFVPSRKFGITDAIQNEYITHHKSDGTIVFADHRISSLTGYFPSEVLWNSAHKYIVADDRPVALFALGQMLTKKKGSAVYRLETKANTWIYLRSVGFVTYNTKMEPEMFVCVNTLLDEKYGEEQRCEFARRYTTQISRPEDQTTRALPGSVTGSYDGAELVDDDDHVYGGRSTNPLAIENLIDDDVKVSGNALIKLKPKGYECPYSSDAADEMAGGDRCVANESDFPNVSVMQQTSGSLDRESGSPEFRHSGSPEFRHSGSPEFRHAGSPEFRHVGSPEFRHAGSPEFRHSGSPDPLTPAPTVSSPLSSEMGSPHLVPANCSMNHPSPSNLYSYANQMASSPVYPYYALTPKSLSPDPRDNPDKTYRHDYPSQI